MLRCVAFVQGTGVPGPLVLLGVGGSVAGTGRAQKARSAGTADGCAQLEHSSRGAATLCSLGPERRRSLTVAAARLCSPQWLPDEGGFGGPGEHPLS